MTITRVWIEEGCISCSLCSDLAPEVFLVQNGENCVVKPEAPKYFQQMDDEIREAAGDCPVEVIKYEEKS
jgi:ferredoxin